MWRTVRIRQKEYEFVRKIAKQHKKSMCEVVSAIVSRFAEEMKDGVDVGDYTITVRGLSAEAKVALSMLISQIDEIIRSSMSAEEKVEKVKALLYTWIVGNKLPAWWQCEESEGEESERDMAQRLEELGEFLAELMGVALVQAGRARGVEKDERRTQNP